MSFLLCLRNSVGLEYRAFNTGVASSGLAGGTYFTPVVKWYHYGLQNRSSRFESSQVCLFYASLAQWLELLFCKQGVVGSSPTWSSKTTLVEKGTAVKSYLRNTRSRF